MKKHYVLKNKKRFYLLIITLSVVLMTTFLATSAYGYKEPEYDMIKVRSGDTLWSIAGKYCNKGDIRNYIFNIKKANNMTTSIIYAGDDIKIPR